MMKIKIIFLLLIFSKTLYSSQENNIFDLNRYKWYLLIGVLLIFLLKILAFLFYRKYILHKLELEIELLKTELDKKDEELKKLSVKDDLTGLNNRKTMLLKIDEELVRNKRYETPFSLLLIDIDNFKDINEKSGNIIGDKIIREIAELINKNTRAIDIICRWNGGEFLILANNTKFQNAIKFAEKIRKIIEKSEFAKIGHLTVSIGVSEYNKGEQFVDLNKRIEQALSEAKENGKNQVVAKDYFRDMEEELEDFRIEWSEEDLSENEMINSQHIELFELANSLVDLVISKSNSTKIEEVLEEIKTKTKSHFDSEEKMLTEINYKNLEKHKKLHFNLIFELERHLIKYRLGEFSNVELLKFISQNLIVDHLIKEDLNYFKVLENS